MRISASDLVFIRVLSRKFIHLQTEISFSLKILTRWMMQNSAKLQQDEGSGASRRDG